MSVFPGPYSVMVPYTAKDGAALVKGSSYLRCIRYDPYLQGGARPIGLGFTASEAFVFRTLAAAEMAAVYVNGWVVTNREGSQ